MGDPEPLETSVNKFGQVCLEEVIVFTETDHNKHIVTTLMVFSSSCRCCADCLGDSDSEVAMAQAGRQRPKVIEAY